MLARVPEYDRWDFHAEEAGREEVEGCGVDAVDKVGSDLGREEGEEVDCAGGDEVVPGCISKHGRMGRDIAYQEDSRKSQWKKKKRMNSNATMKWVALKNS